MFKITLGTQVAISGRKPFEILKDTERSVNTNANHINMASVNKRRVMALVRIDLVQTKGFLPMACNDTKLA